MPHATGVYPRVTSNTKLAVIVHGNDEVSVLDERKHPLVCKDCRFAGWLTEWEFNNHEIPRTCLHYSGGADPRDGDRVIYPDDQQEVKRSYKEFVGGYYPFITKEETVGGHDFVAKTARENYPLCEKKNPRGNCKHFVRAKEVKEPWWAQLWFLPRARRWRRAQRRKMRL